ncbi:MAG: hypothetical protein OXH15_05810 [Gammaproteobacteria bacterium]|nr:hypothetical protein [Gammaproteobacteria bacterium]
MGIFTRTKERQEQPAPVAADAPFTEAEVAAVKELLRLTALPPDEFDATYGALLRRSWGVIAAPRGPDWTAVRERTLACLVAALKVRRAHVLPRFAAAEDAYRLTEAMSFALAACVVAERLALVLGRATGPGWCPLTGTVPADIELADVAVPRSFGALLLPRLLGETGRQWLGEQPEALREAAAYFGGGPSQLRDIADDAAARIDMSIDPAGSAETAVEDDCAATPQAEGEASGPERGPESPPSAETGPETPDPDGVPSDIGTGRVGWRWFNWVRAGLRDGTIAANAEGGWLHNIEGSAYVVDPDCFEALAAAESMPPKSIRNRVLKLGRHRTRRSAGGRADAFPAELADGRRVSGMLFDGELLWDEDAPPASTSVLR